MCRFFIHSMSKHEKRERLNLSLVSRAKCTGQQSKVAVRSVDFGILVSALFLALFRLLTSLSGSALGTATGGSRLAARCAFGVCRR